jgi:tRNA-Thr(GGU) m(6)t(6)A37 methyltransferase TsaA
VARPKVYVDRLELEPIGIIYTEHHDPARTPIQPVCTGGAAGRVVMFSDYVEGLDDVEGFSHLHLIYWFHRARDLGSASTGPPGLKVVPYLDDVPRGVFATRSPARPNPIGLSLVRLVERRGAELLVADLDVLDGTPLLDIKPYVEGFDLRLGTRGGWTEKVSVDAFRDRGERRSRER